MNHDDMTYGAPDPLTTEEAAELANVLTKHGLLGSPLREGTRCTRLSADGEPCGLEPPCPDCGRACHDVPEGA